MEYADAATQTAVSFRFCDVIPPDKAFYLAVRLIVFSYMSSFPIFCRISFFPAPPPVLTKFSPLFQLACKDDSRWESMAFVLLNHYLDISEAIEEGDPSTIDNSDFVGTDIPAPYDYALPKSQYLDED